MASELEIFGMTEWLESMLKESDQKWERDLARIESKLEAALEEIKSLIHGMTL